MPEESEPGSSSFSSHAGVDPQEEPEQPDTLLDIDVTIADPAWQEALPEVEQICVESAIAAIGAPDRPTELSIVLTADEEVRVLNRDYRGKDKPTNVLSFPSGQPVVADGPVMLGDVVLALGVVTAEAERDGKAFQSHLRHLVIHGVLHLLGFDHETDSEAEEMERREVELLDAFGVSDPYSPITEAAQ